MGKLQEMVVEETSIGNRFKYNTDRIQLAGIGLFAKLEEEREKLYQQIVDASGQAKDDSLLGRLNTLGNGTVNFVKEESQRIFDELVVAGEQFKAKDQSEPEKAVAPKVEKPAKKLEVKTAEVKPIKVQATEQSKKAIRKTKQVEIDLDLQKAFEAALEAAKQASDLPQEKHLALLALALQVEEGDVKGRRPAKTKAEACEIFDARREIKGMKQDEAMNRYIEVVKALA